MVFNLPGSVREGVEISVTLQFEKSGEMRVPVSFVKSPQAQAHNR
jgi:copper(I)-binding protein